MNPSGKCLCGAVSYSCSADPVIEGNCHCNDCQKASGSGYSPTMFFPKESISISGEVKWFESKAKSGNLISRGFCPNCGSQIFGKPAAMPDLVGIRAGTLDDISRYKPQIDLFTSHAAAWDFMDESLPKFPEMPPPE